MGFKRTPLTQKQADLVFDLQKAAADWFLDDVPADNWDKIPGLERREDTVAIVASGGVAPKVLNNINAVIGFDVLVVERNPKANELEGNAYHYVIQKTAHATHPFILNGPYRTETRVPHWFDAADLDKYWDDPEPMG